MHNQSYIPQGTSLSAEPFFHLLDFGVLNKDSARTEYRVLSMRGMLLGYNFEPRPNSHALATAGSVTTRDRFINKRMLALEKTSLTRENEIDSSRSLGCGDPKGLT